MNSKIIIVAGYVAAGKTTFALNLSKELNIPCFSKDLLKLAISRSIPVNNREDGKRLSAATFDAIAFITEKFMETGMPLIIEANFVMTENHNNIREGETLKLLIDKYGYQTLTYILLGDSRVLCDRFNEREKTPERGEANKIGIEISYENYDRYIIPLGDFTVGGEIIKIDTTNFNTVDFKSHIESARKFINSTSMKVEVQIENNINSWSES